MNTRLLSLAICSFAVVLTGCVTKCGPGTVKTEGEGWDFQIAGLTGSISGAENVCVPISPVNDCTEFQMVEEDGGGHSVDRDGGGHRVDRDGGGGRKERDEPHHPADAGGPLDTVDYVPTATCRVGVEAPDPVVPLLFPFPGAKQPDVPQLDATM